MLLPVCVRMYCFSCVESRLAFSKRYPRISFSKKSDVPVAVFPGRVVVGVAGVVPKPSLRRLFQTLSTPGIGDLVGDAEGSIRGISLVLDASGPFVVLSFLALWRACCNCVNRSSSRISNSGIDSRSCLRKWCHASSLENESGIGNCCNGDCRRTSKRRSKPPTSS